MGLATSVQVRRRDLILTKLHMGYEPVISTVWFFPRVISGTFEDNTTRLWRFTLALFTCWGTPDPHPTPSPAGPSGAPVMGATPGEAGLGKGLERSPLLDIDLAGRYPVNATPSTRGPSTA